MVRRGSGVRVPSSASAKAPLRRGFSFRAQSQQAHACTPITGFEGNGGQPPGFITGQVVIHDAQPLPTSKAQCKHSGWQSYGVFKDQGDCVSFVATGGKNPPAGP